MGSQTQILLNELSVASLPQDPFLPVDGPFGPAFLDTEACICALRRAPLQNQVGWQCLGNKTELVYTTTRGKWFPATGGSINVNSSVSDAQNPPDTTRPQVFDITKGAFQSIGSNDTRLDIFSNACTGQNQTTFSTAYYRSVTALANNAVPVDAAPCFRPGAVPLQIQAADDWLQSGCLPGFLCRPLYLHIQTWEKQCPVANTFAFS